jgi:hypothetical protein
MNHQELEHHGASAVRGALEHIKYMFIMFSMFVIIFLFVRNSILVGALFSDLKIKIFKMRGGGAYTVTMNYILFFTILNLSYKLYCIDVYIYVYTKSMVFVDAKQQENIYLSNPSTLWFMV